MPPLTTSRELSSFLRASAAGQNPEPPAPVRETQRRFGFGSKLSRSVVLAILTAFALGVAPAPVEAAEAAPVGQMVAPKPVAPFKATRLLPQDTQLVVFGNNHTSLRQVDYVISQLPALKERGFNTLYLELPRKDTRNLSRLRADYESAIDNLTRSDNPAAKSELIRMQGMLRLLLAGQKAKMEIVGVDREMREVTAKNGALDVPVDSRVEFYRKYVIARNLDFAKNVKAHGKPGVFYVGRVHAGIKNNPMMSSIEKDLGADGQFDLKQDLAQVGVPATVIILSSQDEVAGLAHPWALLMEQRKQTDDFRLAKSAPLSGDYLMFVPEISKSPEETLAMSPLPAPNLPEAAVPPAATRVASLDK